VGAQRRGITPRFFFDRNLGKRVPEALERDGWLVELHDDHFEQTTPDVELLGKVASRGWILVTQDKRIRFRAAERRALTAHGLQVFTIASTANLGAAETIEALRRAHGRMIAILEAHENEPFVFAVHKDGSVRRMTTD